MQTSQKAFAVVVGIGLIALVASAVSIGVKKLRGEGFDNKEVNIEGFDEMHQADKLGLILGSIVVIGIVGYYIGRYVNKVK